MIKLSLNRKGSTPLYDQLKRLIEDKIKTGQLKPDQQLPSERELCDIYSVSRITIRQAIALAESEGLLYRKQGLGTFVAKPKISQELSKVNNFQNTLSKQGLIANTEKLSFEAIACNFQISRLLNIDIMDKVINLRLVGLGDDRPIVFYDSYFNDEIGKKMMAAAEDALQKNTPFSTLDLYKQIADIEPTHVEQTFEAQVSDEQVSAILNIEKGTPIFRVTSIVYSYETPIEYKETHYCGDKYKFFITRSF